MIFCFIMFLRRQISFTANTFIIFRLSHISFAVYFLQIYSSCYLYFNLMVIVVQFGCQDISFI